MSTASIAPEFDRLSGRIVTGTEALLRVVEAEASDERVSELAGELWDVTAEIEALLETVDLEALPDGFDSAALPELIDLDGIPAAIREHDLDRMLDLDGIDHAIELRSLWNAVDLVEFRAASRRLAAELEDVVGSERLHSTGDSDAAADVGEYFEEVESKTTNAAIQQQAKKRVKRARSGVIRGHSAFEDAYVENRRRSGSGRRSTSRNPTAVSLRPSGPIPDSASARYSTVPAAVRHAKIDPLPRIYARRWRSVGDSR